LNVKLNLTTARLIVNLSGFQLMLLVVFSTLNPRSNHRLSHHMVWWLR